MKSTAERLEEARQYHDLSIKKFAKRLTDAGVPSSSYSSVRNYLVEGKKPRKDFLLAAADVLQVSRDYLVEGKGHLTAVDAALTEVQEAAAKDLEAKVKQDKFIETWKRIPGLMDHGATVNAAFGDHLGRWALIMIRLSVILPASEKDLLDQLNEYSLSLWKELNAPLEYWRGRTRREIPIDPQARGDFILAQINARNLALQAIAPPGWNPEEWPAIDDQPTTAGKEE